MKKLIILAMASLIFTVSVTAYAAARSDRIKIRYDRPENPEHEVIYEGLKKRGTLEKAQQFLSPYKLPRNLTIRLSGCDGEADAWYGDKEITLCYEYIHELWKNMPDETTPSGIEPIDTVIGPFFDTLLHEFAHALFDMLDIPILGRNEDAADQVAAYIYLQLGPEESRRAFEGTAWAFLSEAIREEPLPVIAYSDDHGTPAQRGYNVLCIAYGADPEVFGDIVKRGYLPLERAEFCEEEYEQVQDAYEALILPHVDEDLAEELYERSWMRKE